MLVSHAYSVQITLANKQSFFQNPPEFFFTYSGAERCPKHNAAFRFSLNQTVFPWLYAEISKSAKFRSHPFL